MTKHLEINDYTPTAPRTRQPFCLIAYNEILKTTEASKDFKAQTDLKTFVKKTNPL